MNAIFYSTTIDADCEDCGKTYEDIPAQIGGGIVVWTCKEEKKKRIDK